MRWFKSEPEDDPIQLTFICVENAGRSQIAAAFAERECERRGLTDRIVVQSAGTHPADTIYDVILEVMQEVDIDLSDRNPQLIQLEELKTVDYLVRLGCDIREFNPELYGDDSREWPIADPKDEELQSVREIRDEIEQRVIALFDEIEADLN